MTCLSLSRKHAGKLLEEILVSAPQTPAHGAVAKPRTEVTPCSGAEPDMNPSGAAAGSPRGRGFQRAMPEGEGVPGAARCTGSAPPW